MAGFTTNINNRSLNPNPVRRFLKQLSSFGMNYKDDVIRNVRSVDIDPKRDRYSADLNTGQIMFQDGSLQSLFAQMATTDPSLSKGYFNLDMTKMGIRLLLLIKILLKIQTIKYIKLFQMKSRKISVSFIVSLKVAAKCILEKNYLASIHIQ